MPRLAKTLRGGNRRPDRSRRAIGHSATRRRWVYWRNNQGEVWLNVGSSYLALEGFVNLDRSVWLTLAPLYPVVHYVLSEGHGENVRRVWAARERAKTVSYDCRKPLPYADGEVDHILCSHFLSVLPATTAERVLADFARVLRPEGTLHVVLADLRYHVERYLTGAVDADDFIASLRLRNRTGDSVQFRMLEALGGLGLHNHWMYDRQSASARMTEAGFEIRRLDTPSSGFRADDPESLHLTGARLRD